MRIKRPAADFHLQGTEILGCKKTLFSNAINGAKCERTVLDKGQNIKTHLFKLKAPPPQIRQFHLERAPLWILLGLTYFYHFLCT